MGYIDCRLIGLLDYIPGFEGQYNRDYDSTFDRDRYDMLFAVKDDPWNEENDYVTINDIIENDYPTGRP